MNNHNITQAINLDNYKTLSSNEGYEVSSKYKFIPTRQVLEVFQDFGYLPSKIQESYTRIPDKNGYQKHVIRLRSKENMHGFSVGSEIPEIVLVNSHCGNAAFNLSCGIYRLVCSNGLMAGHNIESYRVLHKGYTNDLLANAIKQVINGFMPMVQSMENMKHIELEPEEKKLFAQSAIELVFDGEKYRVPDIDVLTPRRREDKKNDLWTVFNTIQENVIKGGIRQYDANNRRIRSREVKSIDRNIQLNRALWTLAEKMQELKTIH